jgi:hypothetical protein
MSYYALPGKEQEVLSIRLSACDVLEKNGVTRGRVLTRSNGLRETKHGDNPDVVWEGRVVGGGEQKVGSWLTANKVIVNDPPPVFQFILAFG